MLEEQYLCRASSGVVDGNTLFAESAHHFARVHEERRPYLINPAPVVVAMTDESVLPTFGQCLRQVRPMRDGDAPSVELELSELAMKGHAPQARHAVHDMLTVSVIVSPNDVHWACKTLCDGNHRKRRADIAQAE